MRRTSRPVPSFAGLLALGGGLGLFVPAAWAGRRIDPHHPIQAAIEALAECPWLPLGWKTGTAPLRERPVGADNDVSAADLVFALPSAAR